MPGTITRVPLARKLVAKFLTDTCTIRRATAASDSQGGSKQTWADLATNVPCHLEPLPNDEAERLLGDRFASATVWRLHLPYGQDVTVRDEVVLGARTFQVQEVDAARTFEVERVVYITELL